jgi:hypothetical protein
MTDSDGNLKVYGVLKRDARGRVKTTAAQRAAVLDEFERSGLSGPQFARVAGIAYQTFATWVQKRRRGGRPQTMVESTPARFVEAVPEAALAVGARGCPALQLHLSCGLSLELAQSAQVALAVELIRALREPC